MALRSPSAVPRVLACLLLAAVLTAPLGCQKKDVAPAEPTPAPAPETRTESVLAHTLNVRQAPDPDSRIIAVLQKSQVVEILGREGNWIHVRGGPLEEPGWVYGAYLSGFAEEIDIPGPEPEPAPPEDEGEAPPARTLIIE
jgi:SH3-like domain-containing protein